MCGNLTLFVFGFCSFRVGRGGSVRFLLRLLVLHGELLYKLFRHQRQRRFGLLHLRVNDHRLMTHWSKRFASVFAKGCSETEV